MDLDATGYFTKRVEEIPTKEAVDLVVIKFLKENILDRFGCPKKIVINNSKALSSIKMIDLFQDFNIFLIHLSNYYPHEMGR